MDVESKRRQSGSNEAVDVFQSIHSHLKGTKSVRIATPSDFITLKARRVSDSGYLSTASSTSHGCCLLVKPVDLSPSCSTKLCVGDLPIETNEDELKALFSCFAEFEDVLFAKLELCELDKHLGHAGATYRLETQDLKLETRNSALILDLD